MDRSARGGVSSAGAFSAPAEAFSAAAHTSAVLAEAWPAAGEASAAAEVRQVVVVREVEVDLAVRVVVAADLAVRAAQVVVVVERPARRRLRRNLLFQAQGSSAAITATAAPASTSTGPLAGTLSFPSMRKLKPSVMIPELIR